MNKYDVTLSDFETVRQLARLGSMSIVARQLQVTPSQVSKAVRRVETRLGAALFSRNAKGVVLTDSGQFFLERLDDWMTFVEGFLKTKQDVDQRVTIAAHSFLYQLLMPELVSRLSPWRLRILELPPLLVRTLAAQSVFDFVITVGRERLPPGWGTRTVGMLRHGLFTSPARAKELSRKRISPESLRRIPFVCPLYRLEGVLVAGEDRCPLPMSARRVGHQAEKLGLALELAAASNELVFGPVKIAKPFVETQRLIEISVPGWDVQDEVCVSCDETKARAKLHQTLVSFLKEFL